MEVDACGGNPGVVGFKLSRSGITEGQTGTRETSGVKRDGKFNQRRAKRRDPGRTTFKEVQQQGGRHGPE
ncbi:hypothetical protein GCM10027346_15040 [Hymenobacter seoulensis]